MSAPCNCDGGCETLGGCFYTGGDTVNTPEDAGAAQDLVDKPDGWPDRCGRCGAPWSEIGFDYADGFNCRRCGGSDADE